MTEKGTVYLIHFEQKYHHAQHYLGWTNNLQERLQRHSTGNGARLIQVITQAGISWKLAKTWSGSRELERQLKRQKNSPRLCPICSHNKEKGK